MSNEEVKNWLFSFGEPNKPFSDDEVADILNHYADDKVVDVVERERVVGLMKDTHKRLQADSEFRQGFRDAVLYHLL